MADTDLKALGAFYESELFGSIMPFWMSRALDPVNGGYFTCFNNRGDRLLYRHKFTWSQGRFVWTLARLNRSFKGRRPQRETEEYLAQARRGAEFLMKHARLPNGNCAFILSEEGRPVLLDTQGNPRAADPNEFYDSSVFADLFVVYGLAEYVMAANDRRSYQFAVELYESACERLRQPVFRSDPYPVPAGYETHGRPMILVETAHEMAQAAECLGDSRKNQFLAQAEESMNEVMGKFRDPATNLITEMYSTDTEKCGTMLGQYVNPGHTLECMWFICHLARRLGARKRIEQAIRVIKAACKTGWDEKYGGFFQFTHRSGGAPRGPVPPELENAEMIRKLRENWDNKLWWPHSEALYTLLLGHVLSQDKELLDWYWRVHEYAFRTFPNLDHQVGEWIQIRTRDGTPVDKVVALPVKDPFHITRAFIFCTELLREVKPE